MKKPPSQRQLRVGEQIKHIIGETLSRGDFHSETLLEPGKVTVSEVRISPDLKNATAYVVSLGSEDMGNIIPALNAETKHFQKEISRQSSMKFTPRITFRADDTFDEAQRIEELLRSVSYSDQD